MLNSYKVKYNRKEFDGSVFGFIPLLCSAKIDSILFLLKDLFDNHKYSKICIHFTFFTLSLIELNSIIIWQASK